MTRNLIASAAALIALALAGIAGASTTATPGVSSSKVTIGSSGPLSGEAAAAAGVLRGADAYFKYVNSRGGVNGRKIDFKFLDDAYDPSQTVENVRQLIQQDNVFALFSVVGTNGNLAIRDFANAAGVPQVFSATGATTFGRDYGEHPWTIGYLPPYSEEGQSTRATSWPRTGSTRRSQSFTERRLRQGPAERVPQGARSGAEPGLCRSSATTRRRPTCSHRLRS